jgi:penicillin-binding protein 1A
MRGRKAMTLPDCDLSLTPQALTLFAVGAISLPVYLSVRGARRGWSFFHGSERLRNASLVLALALLCASAASGLLVYGVFFAGEFPSLDRLMEDPPPTIGRIEDARGQVLAELAYEYRRPVDDLAVPPVLRQALLAAEDKNFFEHRGIDLTAVPRIVAKAVVSSIRCRRLSMPQGGSTLTMQLSRIVFLREWTSAENGARLLRDALPDRLLAVAVGVPNANKLRRKVEEIRLSLWLESELEQRLGSKRRAKEEILRRYAAYVYLGDGRYGFEAAAEHYLGRSLETFDARDAAVAALLAGIPKSPGRYAPTDANGDRCLRRRNHILEQMADLGYLSGAESKRSRSQPVPVAHDSGLEAKPHGVSAAVDVVFHEIKRAGDTRANVLALFEGRIRVKSSIDRAVQTFLTRSLEDGLRAYEARHPASRGVVQCSAVVLGNGDARILALAGGRQVFREKEARFTDLNRVTDSRRQAGSAMKPLVYLTAFRRGASLDSEVLDEPVAVPMGNGDVKWIRNYDGSFRGPIPLRRALAESRNAATVRLAQAVGVGSVIRTAHELGIQSPLPPYISTTLGAADVTLIELANAYRTLASGLRARPRILDRVTTTEGLELFRHSETPRPRDDPALGLIQEGLRGVVRLPGGTAHSLASLPVPVMGKTGTTNDFRDALFIGSTFGPGGVTVAVRIGFDDNRSLGSGETGGRVAVPVFRGLLEALYRDGSLGAAAAFPQAMEQDIDQYLASTIPAADTVLAGIRDGGEAPAPVVPAEAPLVVQVDLRDPSERAVPAPSAAENISRTEVQR